MFNCFLKDHTAVDKFYLYGQDMLKPMVHIGSDHNYAVQSWSYKIYLICFATNLILDQNKIKRLQQMLIDIVEAGETKKIFRDAITALEYGKNPDRELQPFNFVRRRMERYSSSVSRTYEGQLQDDISGFEHLVV